MQQFVNLKNGLKMPKLGMGMWNVGERPELARSEAEAIRVGIESGLTLIDTAEMYGQGRSESFIGQAIKGYDRSTLFLTSKVLPSNASRTRIRSALLQSLKRLGTDYLDLYLYHWIGSTPFPEVVESMEQFVQEGLIRAWGVSNFDTADLQELLELKGGRHCVVNQVLYHLGSRGIEFSLLPYMRQQQIITMAYCPLAQAGGLCHELYEDETVLSVARAHGASAAQILLAFVLAQEDLVAIPKSSSPQHMRDNAAAAQLNLTQAELERLSLAFPAPQQKTPLDIV